jgi:hypothetical protein
MENFKHFPQNPPTEYRAEYFCIRAIEKGRFQLGFQPQNKKFITSSNFTGF